MIFIRFLILLCLSYIIILRIAPILFFDPHGSKGIGQSLEIYGVSTQIKRNLLFHIRGIYIVKSLIYRIFDAFSGVGSGETFRERVERLIAGEDFLFMTETHAAACVSAGISTLQRFLKTEYGKPFSELRTAMKIEKSKRFLSESDYSVRRIADELGFYDQSYFCKIFKKHEGVSPKEYARKFRPI